MKMVRVGPNPNYKLPALKDKASQEEKDAWNALKASWAAVKESRVLTLPYVTAMDNVENSGGMYAILAEKAAETSSPGVRMPEEMTADELKLTALQLGVDLSKPMKKADLVKTVRLAMDKVMLLEDDSDEDEA